MNFKEKKEALRQKYLDQVNLLSKVHSVDTGVALDMLITNETQNGQYSYVNHEEFAKDYAEVLELAKEESK